MAITNAILQKKENLTYEHGQSLVRMKAMHLQEVDEYEALKEKLTTNIHQETKQHVNFMDRKNEVERQAIEDSDDRVAEISKGFMSSLQKREAVSESQLRRDLDTFHVEMESVVSSELVRAKAAGIAQGCERQALYMSGLVRLESLYDGCLKECCNEIAELESKLGTLKVKRNDFQEKAGDLEAENLARSIFLKQLETEKEAASKIEEDSRRTREAFRNYQQCNAVFSRQLEKLKDEIAKLGHDTCRNDCLFALMFPSLLYVGRCGI